MACGSTSSRHRSDLTASSVAVPQPRTVVEYRKDGAVSKMRSHKGNIPVLPQTKLCPHCPAKFTRTTHLNRHLRTHTGDRSHRCDTCDAQFTRSDLLTRHKKTCGDSSHANRTRRRSCQACADSKVKCDLQRPCSKCQARGKECVFVIRSSRSSGIGMVPTLSATTMERTSGSEARVPVLIPATPHPVASPSPKPYIPADHLPIDQQPEGDCHWVATSSGVGASPDTVSAGSPSDRFCSGSASSTGSSPGSVPSQSPFPTLFSTDFLDPFNLVYPGYNNTSVHSDHSHSPSDPAVPSPISAVDDPTSFAPQVQHPFHASPGGSVYYAPSAEQLQDVISKEHVRQRYAHDHFMPSFSGPAHHNFKPQNLTEEHHYVFDLSHAHGRSRAKNASPYPVYTSARRPVRDGHVAGQLHLTFVDALDGDYYGRNSDKSVSQSRVGASSNPHWPVVSLDHDTFDPLPRLDDQRYRAAVGECAVDAALQWGGAHVARRQVIDPA